MTCICAYLFGATLMGCSKPAKMELAGAWRYRLDENETGEKDNWYAQRFDGDSIALPAALRDSNIGTTPSLSTQWTGSIFDSSWYYRPELARYRNAAPPKFPFWLTPVKRFVGKAWYQREISIPKEWLGKSLKLYLERPHWQTKVWFDDVFVSNQNSLSTPHIYWIPSQSISSGKHRITICVDNAIREVDPGINAHSITDHTQGNWNGIIGKIEIRPVNATSIAQVRLTPSLQNHEVRAEISLYGADEFAETEITLSAKGLNHTHHVRPVTRTCVIEDGSAVATLDMGDNFRTWSEFTPNLYQLDVMVKTANGETDHNVEVFGMREFTINRKHFEINGRPVFLRGTTECSVFPLTGYPPTGPDAWTKIFETCKSYGLNHMRFHSYCPPEAAFIAADKAGIYLQIEGPSWAKYSVTLGDGKPIDAYLMQESKRIIDSYGNHPSFVMMAYGNEPSGHYVPYLEQWVEHFRAYDPQRVFTGASTGRSWSIIENSDYIVRSPPRGLAWDKKQPESVFDYRNNTEHQNRPYVTFEMGQWCVFPNFDEIDKYTGALKALNFELFKEDLEEHHMGAQAHDFLMASGKLQASCYKLEIEATLRTPNLAGFQLLSLNDFPGQGTALVGVLDAFWDEKGYINADKFRHFCSDVVPLVRLPKYTFSNTEDLSAAVEIFNYSGRELENAGIIWSLCTTDSAVVASGKFNTIDIPVGHGNTIGKLHTSLEFVKNAQKLILQIRVGSYLNTWNIWVYPQELNPVEINGLHITAQLDVSSRQILEDGGRVLLMAAGHVENGKDVEQHYLPAFWNTSWYRMRPPHTTGVFIDQDHPAFDEVPTDDYSDLQWWELVNKQQVMNLEHFPPDFRPIIQPIDTWFLNRRLAMLFEARVGRGSLMVCSIDLNKEGTEGLVSKQFYHSLLSYLQSDVFRPEIDVAIETIMELFEKKERDKWRSYINGK